jgi:hypothetical protein
VRRSGSKTRARFETEFRENALGFEFSFDPHGLFPCLPAKKRYSNP